MVLLGGGRFLMCEVPMHSHVPPPKKTACLTLPGVGFGILGLVFGFGVKGLGFVGYDSRFWVLSSSWSEGIRGVYRSEGATHIPGQP